MTAAKALCFVLRQELISMAQQWEYHVEMITATSPTAAIPGIEKKLNDLGADGWEAITNVTGQVGIYLLFKRPK